MPIPSSLKGALSVSCTTPLLRSATHLASRSAWNSKCITAAAAATTAAIISRTGVRNSYSRVVGYQGRGRSVFLGSSSFTKSLFSWSKDDKDKQEREEMADYPVKKSEEEWRAVLSPEQFRVLRTAGTEPPNSSSHPKKPPTITGTYNCVGCSCPLYTASSKFDSGCGWPAYFESIPGAVKRFVDNSAGMQRIEIVCAGCGGHLGHVFKGEGFGGKQDERHCVNGVCLRFGEEGGRKA